MKNIRSVNAKRDPQSCYDYMRIPDGWDRWVSNGASYAWSGNTLYATDSDGRQWKFDPYRDEWARFFGVVAA